MKVKFYAIAVVAVLVTVFATSAIAREYFEGNQPEKKVMKAEPAKAEMAPKMCNAKFKYPVSPQDKKRADAIFYWNPEARHNDAPRAMGNRTFGEVIYVSDYPCKRCVLSTSGKYEYRTNRSN